jgi:hypothetical protein
MISKTFYQQLRSSERQSLVGPPESMREHVVAASKAMRTGNWTACNNFIINEKMNAKVLHYLKVVLSFLTIQYLLIIVAFYRFGIYSIKLIKYVKC